MDFLTFLCYYAIVDAVGSAIVLGIFYFKRNIIRARFRTWLNYETSTDPETEEAECPSPDTSSDCTRHWNSGCDMNCSSCNFCDRGD